MTDKEKMPEHDPEKEKAVAGLKSARDDLRLNVSSGDSEAQEAAADTANHAEPAADAQRDELEPPHPQAITDDAPHAITDGFEKLVGHTVGEHYELIAVVGSGGLGVVYKARHLLLDRLFAIKFLLPGKHFDSKAIMRFQREAQSAVGLKHENIAAVQEFGIYNDMPFLVMEFVEGVPLSDVIRNQGALEAGRVFNFLKQATSAFSHAHSKGIVHRDIKPDNMMISKTKDGKEILTVIDFGIAKLVENEEARNLTQTGEVFGTPNYMSPEQCQGKKTDYRSDVYSLGCVGYEMITGVPPFRADSMLEVLLMHVNNPAPAVKAPKEFSGLERVIACSLNKDPQHRYESASTMLADLQRIETGQLPTKARSEGLTKPVLMKRFRIAVNIMTGLLALFLVFLFVMNAKPSVQSLTQQIERNQNDLDAYIERAQLYRSQGSYREAVSDFNKALKLNPKYAHGYRWRSDCLRALGSLPEALKDASMAISLMPKDPRAYIERAAIEDQMGQYEAAIKDCTESLRLNPNNIHNNRTPAYINRASANSHLGRYKEAVADATEAIKLYPHMPNAFVNRAQAYFNLKNYEAGLADCNSALALDPKSTSALHNRALIYLGMDKPAQALEDLDEAITLDPSDSEFFVARSDANLKLGKPAEAVDDLTSALKVGADKGTTLEKRAYANFMSGQYKQCIEDCQAAAAVLSDRKYVKDLEQRATEKLKNEIAK